MLPLLAVLVSLALQPAFAKEGAKFRAIVAGVTDYRGGLESNPPLNLDKAARLMRDAVRDVARLNGFVRDEDIDIRLLVDRGKSDGKPTRANFVDQLQIVARASDKGDWLVVYFTGHGKEDRLLLSGSFPDLAGGHLDFSVVKKIIQASEASAKLIFIDTCRTLNAESSLGVDDTFSASNQLRKSVPEGEAWFFSTRHGYPSHVDKATRYGYYTKFLLAGLQEYSANPTLTGEKLGTYLKRMVKNAVVAAKLGSPQKPFDQIASGFNLWGETKGVSTVTTDVTTDEQGGTPVGNPGLYLTVEGKKGQLLTPGMIRVVTDSRGSLPDDGARPTSYKRDLAGACLVRDMEHGTGLQWSDIGALCDQ